MWNFAFPKCFGMDVASNNYFLHIHINFIFICMVKLFKHDLPYISTTLLLNKRQGPIS